MSEKDYIQRPVDEGYQRGIESMGRGRPASAGEWLEAIARMMAMGLALRGGLGPPMIRFPLGGAKVAKGGPRKVGAYPAREDLKFIASESPDMAFSQEAPFTAHPPGRVPAGDRSPSGPVGQWESQHPQEVRRLMDVLTSLYETPWRGP